MVNVVQREHEVCRQNRRVYRVIFFCPLRWFLTFVRLLVTDQSATEADGEILEGVLNRKHEWESTTKKASNR